MKLSKIVKVKNPLGLHARPAAHIVKMLQTVKSSVYFSYKGETVNARSIMSILILAASKNARIEVSVDGEDAQLVLDQLVEAFDQQFGEKLDEKK